MNSAVILAAGMGTRLRTEHSDLPKGFLKLGDLPIIEESILRLEQAGISDIVIVTGYGAEHYQELAERYVGLIRLAHNPVYADSGSMYSLYCARDIIDDGFLLLESDLIYESRALEVLLAHESGDAILLAGASDAGDEVYVETQQGKLLRMSKDRAELGEEVAGELVGISKISGDLFQLMNHIAAKAFETSLKFDYETDCLVQAAASWDIPCPVVNDLLWSEIDDPAHLARAKERIYPAIGAAG